MSRRSVVLAATVLLLLAVVIVGALAYAHQLAAGEVVTSMRTLGAGGVVWGLYVAMDGLLLSAGIAVMACACIARFFRDRELEATARIAAPVAIACSFASGLGVLADQGRPLAALWNLFRVARPQSPIFATFTMVLAVCLFASLVHCLLARRPDLAKVAKQPSRWQWLQRLLAAGYRGTEAQRQRRQQVGFWMSLLLLPLLAIPLSSLTILFTARPGRPPYLVVGEAISFTVSAGAAGVGLLLVAGALAGWLSGSRAGLGPWGFARLGRGLLLVDALAVLSAVVVEVVGLHAGAPAARHYAEALLGDVYGSLFWAEIGLFLVAGFILWWGAWRTGLRPRGVVLAGLLSLIAVFLQRHLLLVAWQTHGLALPYAPGSYSPSWVETAVVAGILALTLLLLLPVARLVPFAPTVYDEQPVAAVSQGRRRKWLVGLWLALGGGCAGSGLLLSLRVGTDRFLDPVLVGSPTLFIAGLCLLATAGAVYELLPDRPASVGLPSASPDA